jgi:hypothetical protein
MLIYWWLTQIPERKNTNALFDATMDVDLEVNAEKEQSICRRFGTKRQGIICSIWERQQQSKTDL